MEKVVEMSALGDRKPAQPLKTIVREAAQFAGTDLEFLAAKSDSGWEFDVLRYSVNGMFVDIAVIPPPTDTAVIQLVLADAYVRCISRSEALERRARRALRRLARKSFGLVADRRILVHELGALGEVWVVPRSGNEDQVGIALACDRVRRATEAVWAEDVVGVRNDRDQIPDEYDDLINIMVMDLEAGRSEAELATRLHDRLRRIYFDEQTGTAADLATGGISQALAARMFS